MIKLKHYPIIDRLGMSLSIICAIHCFGGPFILMIAPWLGSLFNDEFFHLFMLLLVFPLAVFSFGQTRSRDFNRPLIIGLIGISFLALSLACHEFMHFFGQTVEKYIGTHNLHFLENAFTFTGGALLFWAHLKNLKTCRCAHSEQAHNMKHNH